ncbi:MAG: hypothetical protein J07HQX50_02068 [Haloquadratum sp. J07HQX50]|nr:MAG: hypothetical protein J07HQX50_02068 [Haloquadratum sp. J07HQX50]
MTCRRILSSHPANVYCAVHVRVYYDSARLDTFHARDSRLTSGHGTNTSVTCLTRLFSEDAAFLQLALQEHMMKRSNFPPVGRLVPALAPVTRVTTLVLSNLAQITVTMRPTSRSMHFSMMCLVSDVPQFQD